MNNKKPHTGIIHLQHEESNPSSLVLFTFSLQIIALFMNNPHFDLIHPDTFGLRNSFFEAVKCCDLSRCHVGSLFDPRFIEIHMFYFGLSCDAVPEFLAKMKKSILETQTLLLEDLTSSVANKMLPSLFTIWDSDLLSNITQIPPSCYRSRTSVKCQIIFQKQGNNGNYLTSDM